MANLRPNLLWSYLYRPVAIPCCPGQLGRSNFLKLAVCPANRRDDCHISRIGQHNTRQIRALAGLTAKFDPFLPAPTLFKVPPCRTRFSVTAPLIAMTWLLPGMSMWCCGCRPSEAVDRWHSSPRRQSSGLSLDAVNHCAGQSFRSQACER